MSKFSRSFATLVLLVGVIAILMVGLAGPGNRFGLWDWMFALGTLFKFGAYAGMAAAGLGIVWLVVGLIRKDRSGGMRALTGFVLGVLAVRCRPSTTSPPTWTSRLPLWRWLTSAAPARTASTTSR